MVTFFKVILLGIIVHFSTLGFAQGKFKAGIGYNLISNNSDIEGLESYIAPSLHFSYNFFKYEKFSIALESATSIKIRESRNSYISGITTCAPILLQYDFAKMMIYLGTGPAYLFQQAKNSQYNHSIEGSYLCFTCGSAFKLKPFFMDIIYPEINFRLSYFRNFNNVNYNAGIVTCIIFIRGK